MDEFIGIFTLLLFSLWLSRVFPLELYSCKDTSCVNSSLRSFVYFMPQTRGLCGHLKSDLDNYPTCLNCSFCCRLSTCEFCSTWSTALWDRFEQSCSFIRKIRKNKETKEKPKKGFPQPFC